jgi:hypothetical protein
MTRARHQSYLLHEAANRYAKGGTVWVGHVCADDAARDFSLMGVTPRNTPRTNIFPGLDEALSSKEVEVEL